MLGFEVGPFVVGVQFVARLAVRADAAHDLVAAVGACVTASMRAASSRQRASGDVLSRSGAAAVVTLAMPGLT